MKTSVVETGKVYKTEGNIALVKIDQGTSCKGCGMGKLGLCKPGGAGMLLKVENTIGAKVGDTVTIGLEKKTHMKGYFIAFILPLVVLLFSSFIGYLLSLFTEMKGLDVVAGFTGLAVAVLYSLKRINKLDRETLMYIRRVVSDLQTFHQGKANYEAERGLYKPDRK
jgi:sigma-E factor negative regulatory protein RseC